MAARSPVVPLVWPSCMLVSGPSGCGKSTFVHRILEDPGAVYAATPGRIVFCYNEYQQGYDSLAARPNVIMIQGLPDLSTLKSYKHERSLLVLDDLMTALDKWPEAERLFTICSHHYDMSVIAVIHSIFYSKTLRNLRMHCSYLVLFRNPPDRLSVRNLATQMYPTQRALLIDAYEDATSEPHSYMLIDQDKSTPERFRLRDNIFPDRLTHCYVSTK